MFKKTTLKNGLRVITIPQKSTQAVTILVLVGTGSKYETKETNGISHFLEHLFFKGTKKRPSTLDIAETLDRVGGMYNAFTSEEYTGYWAKVGSEHFDLALDWVSDIFLNSKLDSKEIKREKGVIIEEINMRYDHPMSYIQVLWSKLLYGDQPAGWDVAGTKGSVMGISREHLLDYMKKQYVGRNTVICLDGNYGDKTKRVIQKIKKCFSGTRKDLPQLKPQVFEKQTKPQVLLNARKTDQTHLYLGFRAFNLFHPQRYAQDLLAIILGGMMSSRLFIKIRERLGIAYYISSAVSANPDTGFLVTQAGVDNKSAEKAISTILKEHKQISQIKVSAKELKKAKDYLKGKMTLLLESSDAKSSFYAVQELLEQKILTPKQVYGIIDMVSSSDILKTAKDIFRPENLNLALIGPFNKEERFTKALEI